MVKHVHDYVKAARASAAVLAKLRRASSSGVLLRLEDHFEWDLHYVLVFELLGPSLRFFTDLRARRRLRVSELQVPSQGSISVAMLESG